MSTPMVKESSETAAAKEKDVQERKRAGKLGKKVKPEDEELLDGSQNTVYRGLAATLNYLAADRCDLMYAAKERALDGKPTRQAWGGRTVRVGRYQTGRPRVRVWFHFSGGSWVNRRA